MVTTQDVGSDREFQTRYYKVSFDLFSGCFFFPCVFEDLGTVNVVIVFGLNIWTAYSIFILKFKHNHMPDTQLDVNPT